MTTRPPNMTPSSDLLTQVARENPEPNESRNPLPALLLLVVGALVSFGFAYYLAESGNDLSVAGDRRSLQRVVAVEVTGPLLYDRHCVSCHGAEGRGVPTTFPPLAESPWVTGDPETLVKIPLLGIDGPIEVLGQRYVGNMPRFGHRLSDNELALVLSHVRSSFGNQAEPITPDFVRDVRASLGERTRAWRGGEELLEGRARE